MPKTVAHDTSSMTKKERIAFAREIAAMHREEARARRRRNRTILIAGLGAAVVVIGGLAGWALWSQHEDSLAGPADMLSDGIVFTGDGTTISAVSTPGLEPNASPVATDPTDYAQYPYLPMYLDFGDSASQKFWATNQSQLTTWLTSGYIALELHPVAGTSEFSKLAANAAACVANGDSTDYLAVTTALFSAGASTDASERTADGVLGAVSGAGVTDTTVLDCVRGDRYAAWVTAASARAAASIPNADVANDATLPVVLVDGHSYTGDVSDEQEFLTFISDTYEAENPPSTATPTPSPTS